MFVSIDVYGVNLFLCPEEISCIYLWINTSLYLPIHLETEEMEKEGKICERQAIGVCVCV